MAGMKRYATSLLLLSLLYLVPSAGSGKSVRVKYVHKLNENEFVIDMQVNDGEEPPLGLNSAVVRLKVTDGLVYEKENNKPNPSHPNLSNIFGIGNFLNDNFQIPAKSWVTLVTAFDRVTPSDVKELMELCFLSKNFMITFKEVEIEENYEWKPPLPKTIISKQFFYKADKNHLPTKPKPPLNLLNDIIK